ncbi:MAG: hypothetical protein KAJ19_24035, partial [Gammaproteobacteria bacterium]|nr:hypothetical protein [Gammaproteobacteria bacterium]
MKKILLISIIFLTLLPSLASAADYYVDVDSIGGACSDSNLGTSITQPWCTIQYAANIMVAGDTVYIREGSYYETDIILANSGTPGNYINYKVYQNENVTIDAGGDWVAFSMFNLDYIKIDGS